MTTPDQVPKSQAQRFQGKHRRYQVYLTVSCSGPERSSVLFGPAGRIRTRSGADLRYTTADCDFLYRNFSSKHYDTVEHERHIRLVNPTLQEVCAAIRSAGAYLSQFITNDDWDGGQITFCFAGHGEEGSGALVFSDSLPVLDAIRLAVSISAAMPPNDRRCRVDLWLDSCFSGAFLAEFLEFSWNELEDRVFPCSLFAAALHDEEAWELGRYRHGVFTYSLLCGSRLSIREVADGHRSGNQRILDMHRRGLWQNGVSYLTGGKQHAVYYENGHLEIIGGGSFRLPDLAAVTRSAILDRLTSLQRR
jgi:hypothetical protein